MFRPSRFCAGISLLVAVVLFTPKFAAAQQKMDRIMQDRVRQMLKDAYDDVRKDYYDAKIHGIDWDGRYHEFQERLKTADTLGHGLALVAGFLEGLNDTHTYFLPPARPMKIDYGFRIQMIGDKAFITRVRPKTDAEGKVHPGDEVIAYNGYHVDREGLHKMNYYYNQLAPQAGSVLKLKDPSGEEREVRVEAKVRAEKRVVNLTGSDGGSDIWQLIREGENSDHLVRQRYFEAGDVMIWKMPEFDMSESEVDDMFGRARQHKALVMDLRGNPGGYTKVLERAVGNLFDHDIKIADKVCRKPQKPQVGESRGDKIFAGKLIVLVDSQSGSAAELFARVVQLEQRGTVMGDRTAGAVMEARLYPGQQGTDTMIFYDFSVTDADLTMKDGKSLEHTGVVPDEIALPTAKDIADGSDPVLARAAEMAGLKVSAADAGKLFPFEWQTF